MKKSEIKPVTLTIEMINEQSNGDIHSDIDFAKTFYPEYPKRNPKPSLKKDFTSKDVKKYSIELEKWEEEQIEYRNNLNIYRTKSSEVDSVIQEYIKQKSGFYNIPQKSQSKVWSKAYEDGHSSGYGEVYGCLCGLIDLFN